MLVEESLINRMPDAAADVERKPILAIAFDGVLHSQTSGWQGADRIGDAPTPGAMQFLRDAVEPFEVHVTSSRTHQPGGVAAMREWTRRYLEAAFGPGEAARILGQIIFSDTVAGAQVTIDGRAVRFDGTWPTMGDLLAFRPWTPGSASPASDERAGLRQRMDDVYRERNRLVAFVAGLFPSGLKEVCFGRPDPGWRWCVYVDTPAGQLSWQIRESELPLFAGLPRYLGSWDGHTTEEKYRRLAQLGAERRRPQRPDYGLFERDKTRVLAIGASVFAALLLVVLLS